MGSEPAFARASEKKHNPQRRFKNEKKNEVELRHFPFFASLAFLNIHTRARIQGAKHLPGRRRKRRALTDSLTLSLSLSLWRASLKTRRREISEGNHSFFALSEYVEE